MPRCEACGRVLGVSGEHDCGGDELRDRTTSYGSYDPAKDPLLASHRAVMLEKFPVRRIDPAELERERAQPKRPVEKPTPPPPTGAGNVHLF